MGGTEFGFQKPTVRKKSDGKLGRLRPSSASRVSSRSSMKRSGGSSVISRSNRREGDWRRFANTSRTHLSHIICCAMKHTSNAASTERKASSNTCNGSGRANRSCPNSKCAIRYPEAERIDEHADCRAQPPSSGDSDQCLAKLPCQETGADVDYQAAAPAETGTRLAPSENRSTKGCGWKDGDGGGLARTQGTTGRKKKNRLDSHRPSHVRS